jgi:hypothetical protein
MTNDNIQMWKELNIDLKSHDTLLNTLRPIYEEIQYKVNSQMEV